jgi:hypothetical protein
LLLVAHKIDATKTAMMTGTTTYGEEMCIVQLLTGFRVTKTAICHQLSAFSLLGSSLLFILKTTWLRADG